MDETQKKKTIFIHIDLGLRATLAEEVRTFILREIPKLIKENSSIDINALDFCEEMYVDEIAEFDSSPEGYFKDKLPDDYLRAKVKHILALINEKDRHLIRSLKYISEKKRRFIIIVIDNAGQRTFEVQQQAFLIAQDLASSDFGMVFVALRPSTYFESKSKGAMSAYKNKVLTISPPPADDVIQRRIPFALRVAEGKEDHSKLSGIRLHLESVVLFLRTTLRSIKSNDDIRKFLSNITGGNTRAVVELITTFFGSPNIDSQKIVQLEEQTGDYKVPLHEFTKHALLGEYAYYHPQSSPYACNIFDVSRPDPKEHFLSSIIVACLTSNSSLRDVDGFVYGEAIIVAMAAFGFSDEQARFALRRLAEKRLIETPHSHYRDISVAPEVLPDSFHFRATSIGAYHIKSWAGRFEFLDATASDTPIFDEDIRQRVVQLASSFLIQDRLDKVKEFRGYLEATWNSRIVRPEYYDFSAVLKNQSDIISKVERFTRNSDDVGRKSHRGKPFGRR